MGKSTCGKTRNNNIAWKMNKKSMNYDLMCALRNNWAYDVS